LRYVTGITAVHRVGNVIGSSIVGVWDSGVAHVVPPPARGYEVSDLIGVNSRGWAAGVANITVNHVGHQHPMLYRDGHSSLLPIPAGYQGGVAYAINTRGDVVGIATKDVFPVVQVAVLWPAGNPQTVITLPTPRSAHGSYAMAITDTGLIGGELLVDNGHHTPIVWTDPSTGHALRVPKGMTGGEVWLLRGDYAAGYVTKFVDSGNIAGDEPYPAEWDLRSGAVRVAPAGLDGRIVALDADGAYVVDEGIRPDTRRDVLVQPGRPIITLPAPAGSTGLYPQIYGMTDDGHRLLGELISVDGVPASGHMFWNCS